MPKKTRSGKKRDTTKPAPIGLTAQVTLLEATVRRLVRRVGNLEEYAVNHAAKPAGR